MRSIDKLAVDFDPGVKGNDIVAIFQCPGREERDAKPHPHPAAGETGRHLELILSKVKMALEGTESDGYDVNMFYYDHKNPKQGIMIANTFPDVYFGKKRPPHEVACNHIGFVSRAICQKRLVLCFGSYAERCYERILMANCCESMCLEQVVVKCCHLSDSALQTQIRHDVEGNVIKDSPSKQRMAKRLNVVSSYIHGRLTGEIDDSCTFARFLAKLKCDKCCRCSRS